jgi:dihydrofolate reductase
MRAAIDPPIDSPAMTRIVSGLAVSLDGYIAGPDDGPEQPLGRGGKRLFDWYFNGDTPSRLYPSFRLAKPSAEFFDEFASRFGAVISGRRTYDISNAWNGSGPLPGAALFVLTHRAPASVPQSDPPYTFVTTGIAEAVNQARTAAGEKDVSIMGSAGVRQALQEGLLDELVLHLVPVLLGGGVRLLDGVDADLRCTRVVDAPGVTHLVYQVIK